MKMARNRDVYFAIVDVREAYDTIPKIELYRGMAGMGIFTNHNYKQ